VVFVSAGKFQDLLFFVIPVVLLLIQSRCHCAKNDV